MKKNVISTIVLSFVSIILPALSHCQGSTNYEDYLESLPGQLKLDEETPQKYLMVTDYIDYDLFGNFIKKKRIMGECTLLKYAQVKWNNIRVSHALNLNDTFPEGEIQSIMENFTYSPLSDVLGEMFFKNAPDADIGIKALIWDLTMFEAFAWYKWDSLKLNTEYFAKDINSEVNIAGAGTIENRDVRITWTGITKTNNEICAIIKYTAMNNPFKMDYQNIMFEGRSHYWGNIYVSLSDKQIEYAELYEDVVFDIKMDGQTSGSQVNTVRNIQLERIQ